MRCFVLRNGACQQIWLDTLKHHNGYQGLPTWHGNATRCSPAGHCLEIAGALGVSMPVRVAAELSATALLQGSMAVAGFVTTPPPAANITECR